jgi:putative endonuclease
MPMWFYIKFKALRYLLETTPTRAGEGSFTSKYKCHYLLWYERHQYINQAIEWEKEIKGWLRSKKIRLIEEENPNWNFLNKDIMEWPPVRTH